MSLYNIYIRNPLVELNKFIGKMPDYESLPVFSEIKSKLPKPYFDNHDSLISCYWRVWELAFNNLNSPTAENGFISNYIDTAFNKNLFLWDSVFILMFARYGCRAFNFQKTLDNMYAKQHPDGFICREISEQDGEDKFYRFDPPSTGPNLLAWSEWEYYQTTGDINRLESVFPVLLAYHQWFKTYRTWPDGSYWSCGWANGSDNMPRFGGKISPELYHGHCVWLDTCLQQIFSARLLLKMSPVLKITEYDNELAAEVENLTLYVNEKMWDEESSFYYDLLPGGSLTKVKSASAYWALLAGIVPDERLDGFIAHLQNVDEFNRPHRIPSLSADHPEYSRNGDYWSGGVWNPINYMVVRGLIQCGYNELAYEIAGNHVDAITEVYRNTDTVWEYYSPEELKQGSSTVHSEWCARPDFVGWGGLPPIAGLFEHLMGIRPDPENGKILWDIRSTDAFGVDDLPFGLDGIVGLHCASRRAVNEKPDVKVYSNVSLTIELLWHGGREIIQV